MKLRKFNISDLKEYTKEERLPFILHWNITEACNLRCTHCCVPKQPVFVSLDSAYEIIDFIKKKNFFLVTLSGGECTLHPNFKEIYIRLKEAGMYISIFTNGTKFTSEIKQLFSQYKPRKVEVSIYGHTPELFSETTQSEKGYDEFIDTLEYLKNEKIRTVVKAPITNKNYQYIREYINIAENYNAEYKFGTFVFPRLDGDASPLKERLEYKKAVDIEFKDKKSVEGFADRVNTKGMLAEPFVNKCSACSNSYTLNADNSFSFCGMMVEPKFKFEANENSIEKAFLEVTKYRNKVIEMYDNGVCKECSWANACPGCPAHLLLENGKINICNEYFYNITKEKLEYLSSNNLLDKSVLSILNM